MDIERDISLDSLATYCFLFGCRQVGKTWLLKKTLNFYIYLDLLKKKRINSIHQITGNSLCRNSGLK